MNPDNVNGKLTSIELDMALDEFKRNLHVQKAYHVELSKLYKARFDSLTVAGFSSEQALDIVKARGFE